MSYVGGHNHSLLPRVVHSVISLKCGQPTARGGCGGGGGWGIASQRGWLAGLFAGRCVGWFVTWGKLQGVQLA